MLVTFAEGRGAAVEIFKVIDRKSKIDAMSNIGEYAFLALFPRCCGYIFFIFHTFQFPSCTLIEIFPYTHFSLHIVFS